MVELKDFYDSLNLTNLDIPDDEECMNVLLDALSKEEHALSSLIQSEVLRINAFINKDGKLTEDFIAFSKSTESFTGSILMKEWLLLRKLETVLSIKKKLTKEL